MLLRNMPNRPSQAEIKVALGKTVPDVITSDLRILFCGINPGLYSGAVGHHFARPGNRFWPTLRAAGFTERVLMPEEERLLIDHGLGITNLVARATGSASELHAAELAAGAVCLAEKVNHYKPRMLAVLGISAYRTAFNVHHCDLGRQMRLIGSTEIWVLPNPSGINAHYQLEDLSRLFGELRRYVFTN